MKILVTGAAGFIGYHVSKTLLEKGYEVIGLDNINNYYDVALKYNRLKELGISKKSASIFNHPVKSTIDTYKFKFIRLNLEDEKELLTLFTKEKFDIVCNLAAQAGVRFSIENPKAYISSNINGFFNILECCKINAIKHLIFASSSSVYGLNKKIPFKTTDNVDSPISMYAATKKSNELMAYTYSHLYKLPTTGLRFFTVYGPWGRPDMAMYLFTKAILNHKPIKIFNNGELERDFTYIDDIVEGVIRVIENGVEKRIKTTELYKIYNIGNNKSEKLTDFIKIIEDELQIKAKKQYLPAQPGDVKSTWADVSDLILDYDYKPKTPLKKGVKSFVLWYKKYHRIV